MTQPHHDKYFEGVLQLRNPTKDIVEFIKSQLKREDVRVAKEVFVPKGVDIYVSSRKFLRTLAKRLKTQFGGEVSLNPRLFTQDKNTQKDVFRVNLLYRAPLLKKGDIVIDGVHIIKVKNVAKFVTGTDIKTDKPYSFLFNSKVRAIPSFSTTVTKTHPVIEVLHPETYQSIEVKNKHGVKPGEKVKVVFFDSGCYIL